MDDRSDMNPPGLGSRDSGSASSGERDASASRVVGERPEGRATDLADAIFARYSPYRGQGFRNHCLRLFAFVELQLEDPQWHCVAGFDRGLAYALCMLHDLGLLAEDARGSNYQQRSAHVVEHELLPHLSSAPDMRELEPIILYNHNLFARSTGNPMAEVFRRAVWIEHSRGLRRYGQDRGRVRAIFERHARDNFDRVLADFWWRTFRSEPWTVVRGILF